MAVPPVPLTYDFESVLYDITPAMPTNPSADPCVVIHLRYKFGLEVKFQANEGGDDDDDDDGVVLLEEPEVQFLFSIPLDRLSDGDYVMSHMLERTRMYLRLSECEYLKALVSDFAASLFLEKGDSGHQGIGMVVMLHSSKVVSTEKNLTDSYPHVEDEDEDDRDDDDDLMEVVEDNFD